MANKLELQWLGKTKNENVEPRLLIEDPSKSFEKHSDGLFDYDSTYENVLIHGDNLLALKALLHDYSGRIKCIYIDPPYNTGAAFEQYDDNVEHSTWLNLMYMRLILLRELLMNDGSVWITLDESEYHYLKVVCDEIFGRSNYKGTAIWQSSVQSKGYGGSFSLSHNYTMVYGKTAAFGIGLLERTEKHNRNYHNPDNDPRGPWRPCDVRNSLVRPNLMYDITTPSGKVIHHPPKGWRFSKETFEKELAEGKIIFSDDETRIIRKIYLCDQEGRVPETIWLADEVGDTREAMNEMKALFPNRPFATPKPERLIQRVLQLATKPGDIVLDSFLGSGTTAAVAHKMKRRWIGIEMGDQAYDYCKVRLDKVIEGKDPNGITKICQFEGGGGYKFYELAPTLINEDAFGQAVINKDYNSDMLAAAVAIHEGFKYEPNKDCYWKQAKNENNTYLYVTTNHINEEIINSIKAEMKEDEFLVLVCKSYDEILRRASRNITIKKIPQSLLKNCQFGVDNYNLNIVCPPEYEYEEEDE